MSGAYAVILGSGQDAGVPQLGCRCVRCEAARADRQHIKLAASLGVVSGDGRGFLLDASPDIRLQAGTLPHLNGILLTHGHIGHYTGLMHVGREAWGVRGMPVWGTRAMLDFLRTNAPWEMLVRLGNIELREVIPGEAIRLSDDLTVEPFAVTHRNEYTDTVGYRVRGPETALLYIPDVDRWDFDLAEMVSAASTAILDGTFASADELPAEVMRVVGHPPMLETVALLGRGGLSGRVRFSHLNHSNPAWDPNSAISARLRDAGARIVAEGERVTL